MTGEELRNLKIQDKSSRKDSCRKMLVLTVVLVADCWPFQSIH